MFKKYSFSLDVVYNEDNTLSLVNNKGIERK